MGLLSVARYGRGEGGSLSLAVEGGGGGESQTAALVGGRSFFPPIQTHGKSDIYTFTLLGTVCIN